MDTSEQYIKMRVAAIPDLGMGTPPLKLTRFYTELVWVDAKADWYHSDGGEATQLERQDQLQGMVGDGGWVTQLMRLWNFTEGLLYPPGSIGRKREIEYWSQFQSWEQLWLAFVMSQLHGKKWSGTEWVASC